MQLSKLYWRRASIGLIVTLVCSIAGQFLAKLPGFSLIGHLVLALLLGMCLQFARSLTAAAQQSTPFIANKFLRAGIILLGFKLNLVILMSAGLKSLEAAIVIVAVMIPLNYFVARFFKVEHTLALLAACGCSICGAAAVMGVSSAVRAKTDQSVLAVAIVAILGTLFTLIEVGLQPFLGFTDAQFGTMAGLSLHEIAHAVAAGGAAGPVGTDSAIIAKLSRVLLLAPVAIIVGVLEARRFRKQDAQARAGCPCPSHGSWAASSWPAPSAPTCHSSMTLSHLSSSSPICCSAWPWLPSASTSTSASSSRRDCARWSGPCSAPSSSWVSLSALFTRSSNG